jgi:hypothetical protein
MASQCKHCTDTTQFTPLSVAPGVVVTILGLIAALIGGGAVGVAIALIGLYAVLDEVCRWLRGGKLICIKHDECAIGLVYGLEPVGFEKPFPEDIDNDYSINIVLSPQLPSENEATMQKKPQGNFITAQPASKNHGLGWVGYKGGEFQNRKSWTLHCEFEGNRPCSFCDAAKAAVAIATVAAVICAIPILGWIACAIASAVAAVALVILLLAGWFGADDDDPSQHAVNPGDGDLHTPDATGQGGDYVVVTGDWVYDAGHDGWNEFHPTRTVQKIHGAPYWETGSSDTTLKNFELVLNDWCEHVGEASSPLTQTEQQRPENQWTVHPELDGCKPEGEPEEPQVPK